MGSQYRSLNLNNLGLKIAVYKNVLSETQPL